MDEFYDLLTEANKNVLEQVSDLDLASEDAKKLLQLATTLAQLKITADKDNADYYDKQEKRRIEEERNKAMEQIERDKQKLTWQRVTFEMAKIVVPAAMSILAFFKAQDITLDFEETGRKCSSIWKDLHLPRIWK